MSQFGSSSVTPRANSITHEVQNNSDKLSGATGLLDGKVVSEGENVKKCVNILQEKIKAWEVDKKRTLNQLKPGKQIRRDHLETKNWTKSSTKTELRLNGKTKRNITNNIYEKNNKPKIEGNSNILAEYIHPRTESEELEKIDRKIELFYNWFKNNNKKIHVIKVQLNHHYKYLLDRYRSAVNKENKELTEVLRQIEIYKSKLDKIIIEERNLRQTMEYYERKKISNGKNQLNLAEMNNLDLKCRNIVSERHDLRITINELEHTRVELQNSLDADPQTLLNGLVKDSLAEDGLLDNFRRLRALKEILDDPKVIETFDAWYQNVAALRKLPLDQLLSDKSALNTLPFIDQYINSADLAFREIGDLLEEAKSIIESKNSKKI